MGLDELDGVRIRTWRSPDQEMTDPVEREEMEREQREKFGNGPATMGENPNMLAMELEGEPIEFEIV